MAWQERREAKILHETVARWCSENNWKFVIVVFPSDLARSSALSAAGAAAVTVTLMKAINVYKTQSSLLPRLV